MISYTYNSVSLYIHYDFRTSENVLAVKYLLYDLHFCRQNSQNNAILFIMRFYANTILIDERVKEPSNACLSNFSWPAVYSN